MRQNSVSTKVLDVVSALKEQGIFISDQPISETVLEKIRNEFYAILDDNTVVRNDVEIKCAVVSDGYLQSKQMSSMKSFFFNSFFKKIAKQYLKNGFDFCHEIYLTKSSVDQSTYANDLHFDVQRQLKFFLYLNEVDEKNGAFHFIPGSHTWVEEFRRINADRISYENREVTRPNELEMGRSIPLNGKAGTWFVFDTNLLHKAGTVTCGERLAIRGHVKVLKNTSFINRIRKIFR